MMYVNHSFEILKPNYRVLQLVEVNQTRYQRPINIHGTLTMEARGAVNVFTHYALSVVKCEQRTPSMYHPILSPLSSSLMLTVLRIVL